MILIVVRLEVKCDEFRKLTAWKKMEKGVRVVALCVVSTCRFTSVHLFLKAERLEVMHLFPENL